MRVSPSFVTCLISCIAFVGGCEGNTIRTISSGSHLPYSDDRWKIEKQQENKLFRYIVWSNHAGASQAAIEALQHAGHKVVERARLQELFNEQQIRLTHTPDDDARVLKVGRLAGADAVVFVEASDRPEAIKQAYVGPYGGASQSSTVHQVSVAVRSVYVESGEILWSGHSTLSQPITDPDAKVPLLTKAAMARAVCPVEQGKDWVELGVNPSGKWGCLTKDKN